MEKLQPVIKQIFWICFALSMMLILFGWWSASADLSTQIDARKSAVDQAFTDAKKNVAGVVPNARWTEAASKKNMVHEESLKRAGNKLWEDQLSARVYPKSISNELNSLKYGSPIKDDALRGRFAQLYRQYFISQLEVIKPFRDGEGLVDVSSAQITQENESRWTRVRPTTPEIWNALEDIWLLHSICESIAMVNKDATRIDKAPLRKLMLLQLRGGDPDAAPGASAGGGGDAFGGDSAGGMGIMGGGGYESGNSFGSGYPGTGGGGAGGGSGPWTAFEGSLTTDLLTEEFGSVGGGGGAAFGGSYGETMMGGDGYESGNSDGGGGTAASAGEAKRYVHEEEGMPYKTRAFILEVKILQQAIPSLLAELTNSKFPVEIVRVDAVFGNSSGGTMMTGGGGSYGGMMGGGGYESGGGGYDAGGSNPYGDMGGGMGMGMGGGGMGMGMGAPGMGMGGGGMDMGMGMGGPGGGLGGLGGLGGATGARGPGRTKPPTAAEQRKIAIGQRLLAEAMRDPDLSTVRVAGLMTVFRSPAEEEAEAEAEAGAEEEAQDTSGVDMSQQPAAQDPVNSADGTPSEGEPGQIGTDESPADGAVDPQATAVPGAVQPNAAIPNTDDSGSVPPGTNPLSPVAPGTAAPPAADGAVPLGTTPPDGAASAPNGG